MVKMKKGISTWAFTENDYASQFALAKKCGFDGVELSLDEEGEVSLSSTEADISKIAASAKEEGIELYSIASGLYWRYAYTSEDKAQREKAKDITKKQIEIAALAGCDTILVVPGATGVDFAPALGVVAYDDAYKRAQEALCELAPYAETCHVSIGVENVWNKFLTSPLEMKTFLEAINSPYVGSYFDVGNVLLNSYPEHWIRILGKHIRKVHFKDFKRCINSFCDLLAGDVNYHEVMTALSDIHYDNWVTAEVNPYHTHNEVMLCHTSMAMDKILHRDEI